MRMDEKQSKLLNIGAVFLIVVLLYEGLGRFIDAAVSRTGSVFGFARNVLEHIVNVFFF